jgi:hypothetical protein
MIDKKEDVSIAQASIAPQQGFPGEVSAWRRKDRRSGTDSA